MSSSLRWVGLAACLLGAGCADRTAPTPAAPAVAPARVLPSLGSRVLGAPVAGAATSGAPPARKLPPPVAMPNGGFRIDLRGSPGHVRTLERQPDGSFKQACRTQPGTSSGGVAP
jgi:hypothetical protein